MKKMKHLSTLALVALAIVSLASIGLASPTQKDQPLTRTVANARFFYVAAMDGDQFDPNLLPDDRAAIARVQDALQKWGKLILVSRPDEADIIIRVQSRGSEDVFAVYDAHGSSSTYLWRVMGKGGLQKGELPLVSQFEKAWDKIGN